jgi:hypothetical protein
MVSLERIGLERGDLHVAGEIARLGAQPALLSAATGRFISASAIQRSPVGADDRAVMGRVGREMRGIAPSSGARCGRS